jgi:hypothetical protein
MATVNEDRLSGTFWLGSTSGRGSLRPSSSEMPELPFDRHASGKRRFRDMDATVEHFKLLSTSLDDAGAPLPARFDRTDYLHRPWTPPSNCARSDAYAVRYPYPHGRVATELRVSMVSSTNISRTSSFRTTPETADFALIGIYILFHPKLPTVAPVAWI